MSPSKHNSSRNDDPSASPSVYYTQTFWRPTDNLFNFPWVLVHLLYTFPLFIVTFLEKRGICSGFGLHLSMCMAACWIGPYNWAGFNPLVWQSLHSVQTPSRSRHETRSREISTESSVSFLYKTSEAAVVSSSLDTLLLSFPGVRVSLRKSLLLEAMTSYFYPLHLVCGLMGLCCYAGGEQWNSLDDDFWAHMRRQWGWEARRTVRAKIDGPKSKVCSGRNPNYR